MPNTELEIINSIKTNSDLNKQYLELPIPLPYLSNKDSIKAIVLGADPSNFSDNGVTRIMNTVFDLPKLDFIINYDIKYRMGSTNDEEE